MDIYLEEINIWHHIVKQSYVNMPKINSHIKDCFSDQFVYKQTHKTK